MKKIYEMSEDEYTALLYSGYFWELYPEAGGKYEDDVEFSLDGLFKIEEDEETI